MPAPKVEFDPSLARDNLDALADNSYPGRGIILGVSEGGEQAVQVYWVMGRSPNSRNRVMLEENGVVRTDPFDASKVEDPSLIIYNAMRAGHMFNQTHVVSNGDQTDTVINHLRNGQEPSVYARFVGALMTRDYEPDADNFTTRITGMTFVPNFPEQMPGQETYAYSLIRRNPATGENEHAFSSGKLEDIPDGSGICFHTYERDNGDDVPLPPFAGSPYAVPLGGDAVSIASEMWDALDEVNRVALAVKTINRQTGEVTIDIVNQLQEAA